MALETIVTDVYLDVYDHDLTPSVIKTIALDNQTRIVRAYLQRNGDVYQPDQNARVVLIALRPDKIGVEGDGETIELVPATGDDPAIYGLQAEITQAMIAVPGMVLFQFRMEVNNEILRTEIFKANNEVALDGSTSEWAEQYQGYNLDELVEEIDHIDDEIANLKEDLNTLVGDALPSVNMSISYTYNGYVKRADGGLSSSSNWRAKGTFSSLKTTTKWLRHSCPTAASTATTTLGAVASLAFYSAANVDSFISAVPLKVASGYGLIDATVEVPAGAKYIRYSCHKDYVNSFYISELSDTEKIVDNEDVQIFTRINHSNEAYGIGADSMLIKLKRSAFTLGVTNNKTNPTNAWQATWTAYYWLMNHPNAMFATNCNFSGGVTSQEVEKHHYPLRYNGVDYPEGEDGQPMVGGGQHTRPYLAIDTAAQEVKYYPIDTDPTTIPSNYNFAFACGNLLLDDGVVVAGVTENYIDYTGRGPRNVFGWDDDYFYIWFCEGRNDRNGGYKFPEIISRLQSYGVTNAVNLDGGGSVCVCANVPNPVKINEYVDAIKIRPTTLNLNYTYKGDKRLMGQNAKAAIMAYIAQVFKPVKADMLRVLSTIYSDGKVRYVYHDEKGGYYRLETVQNPPTLQYIAFDAYPTLEYSIGDTLDLTGAVVAAAYSDDTVENVTDECIFTPANGSVLSASDTTLTASYTDGGVSKTVSVPLNVT